MAMVPTVVGKATVLRGAKCTHQTAVLAMHRVWVAYPVVGKVFATLDAEADASIQSRIIRVDA